MTGEEGQEYGAVLTTITITRRYYPDRDNADERDAINVETTGDPTLMDILGLLEFAKFSIAAGMIRDDPVD